MTAAPKTLVMMALTDRVEGMLVVRVENKGAEPIRARVQTCGFDKTKLNDDDTRHGEFRLVQWGKLGGRMLLLPAGATKTSQPFRVSGDKTHVVVYGEGDNLANCHCELEPTSAHPESHR